MPLPSKTLDALQAVGAAAFKADVQLKTAVKDYATQVRSAMRLMLGMTTCLRNGNQSADFRRRLNKLKWNSKRFTARHLLSEVLLPHPAKHWRFPPRSIQRQAPLRS